MKYWNIIKDFIQKENNYIYFFVGVVLSNLLIKFFGMFGVLVMFIFIALELYNLNHNRRQ